jgi:hypothetical protein
MNTEAADLHHLTGHNLMPSEYTARPFKLGGSGPSGTTPAIAVGSAQ